MSPAGNDVCLRQMMCAVRHIAAKRLIIAQHIMFSKRTHHVPPTAESIISYVLSGTAAG